MYKIQESFNPLLLTWNVFLVAVVVQKKVLCEIYYYPWINYAGSRQKLSIIIRIQMYVRLNKEKPCMKL